MDWKRNRVGGGGGNSELKSEYFGPNIQSDYWLQLFLRSHAFISSIVPVNSRLVCCLPF